MKRIEHVASAILLSALSTVALGCHEDSAAPTADSSAAGCAKDTDCKGERVCQDGKCVETPKGGGAGATGPKTAPADGALGADGLPVTIPAPGSTPPTTEEWNAVTREVTVRGSSARNCETKMLREWLRVTCRKKGGDVPTGVVTKQSAGQQAYVFNADGLASVVVQVVPAKEYKGTFSWTSNGSAKSADLVVSWPGGAPRPSLYFEP